MGGPVLLYSGCNNRRFFDERDLKWIQDLVCLKKCGMSIQEMKACLDLCLQGPATPLREQPDPAGKRPALTAKPPVPS